MNDLMPLLLVLLSAAIAFGVHLWRKVARLETGVRSETQALEESRQEVERLRREVKEKGLELEQARKHLQETKGKLKRHQKEAHAGGPKKKTAGEEEASEDSVASLVRASNQDLEAEHRRTVERLERELAETTREVDRLKMAEEKGRADAAKAMEALALGATPEPPRTASAPEQAEALRAELDAFRHAAAQREKALRAEIEAERSKTAAALKRASGHQSLYQIIKGQLELAEDKLALLRRKYEGAKRPEELKSARPEPSHERSSEANGATSTEVDEIEQAAIPERASSEAGAGS